jgi:hypothetical protein
LIAILKAHCLCGLSRIALVGIDSAGIAQSAESYARDCLGALDGSFVDETFLSEWRAPGEVHPMFSQIKKEAEEMKKQPLPEPFDNTQFGFATPRG